MLFFGASAQTASKPSAIYSKEKTAVKTYRPWLPEIKNPKDFDLLSRIFNEGTGNEMRHILFAIDRSRDNKVYYINTPKYEYHLYFLNDLLNENFTPESLKNNYLDTSRRFILGTISYQSLIRAYTYECWEGDKITAGLLATAQKAIRKSFSDSILFKTNSTLQEDAAKAIGIPYITQEQLVKESPYIALNPGRAKGRIRIADSIEGLPDIDEHDILVLKEVPISIPAVAGVITDRASTLLSHVNILARGLKIPSIYIKDASAVMQRYNGKYVELRADANGYNLKEIPEPPAVKATQIKYAIRSDKTMDAIMPLDKIRSTDHIYVGAKAANLGTVKAKMKNVIVPDGFAIPFAHYDVFMKRHHILDSLEKMQHMPGFNEHPAVRRAALEKLRNSIESAEADSAMVRLWIQQWQSQLQGKGVFVRSSSNGEDLKNFSGAGLFSTIPNVTTAPDLEKAVKKVWASVYNFEAYESRRRAGIPDSLLVMSVFVQLAANSDISGVMITKDPYNPLRRDITYIAAKRGIGIKVVEGQRIAEQVMYSDYTKAIQLLSQSEEDAELRLDENGGVKEVAVKNRNRVLSDALIVQLAERGQKIKKLFKGDMDIEWAVAGDQIIILQARPYK